MKSQPLRAIASVYIQCRIQEIVCRGSYAGDHVNRITGGRVQWIMCNMTGNGDRML